MILLPTYLMNLLPTFYLSWIYCLPSTSHASVVYLQDLMNLLPTFYISRICCLPSIAHDSVASLFHLMYRLPAFSITIMNLLTAFSISWTACWRPSPFRDLLTAFSITRICRGRRPVVLHTIKFCLPLNRPPGHRKLSCALDNPERKAINCRSLVLIFPAGRHGDQCFLLQVNFHSLLLKNANNWCIVRVDTTAAQSIEVFLK